MQDDAQAQSHRHKSEKDRSESGSAGPLHYLGIGLFIVNGTFLIWLVSDYLVNLEEFKFLWDSDLAFFFLAASGTAAGGAIGLLIPRMSQRRRHHLIFASLAVFFVHVIGNMHHGFLSNYPLTVVTPLLLILCFLLFLGVRKLSRSFVAMFASHTGPIFSIYVLFAAVSVFFFPDSALLSFEKADPRNAAIVTSDVIRAKLPDVFMILFDGYGLRGVNKPADLKYDANIGKLLEMGFDIYDHAYSNYPITLLSLPSIFQGRLLGDKWAWSKEVHALRYANSMFREVRKVGYEVIVYSGYGWGRLCDPRQGGIRCISPGRSAGENALRLNFNELADDLRLLVASTLSPMPFAQRFLPHLGFSLSMSRLRIGGASSALAALRALEADVSGYAADGRPNFVFAHLMLPHNPYLVDQECRTLEKSWNIFAAEAKAPIKNPERAYKMQSRCANKIMRGFAELLDVKGGLDRSLVLYISDHGSGVRLRSFKRMRLDEWRPADIQERFSVFLGVKFPGQKRGRIKNKLVQMLDLAPAVLNSLGGHVPKEMQGKDFTTYEPESIRVGLADYYKEPIVGGNNPRILYRSIRSEKR